MSVVVDSLAVRRVEKARTAFFAALDVVTDCVSELEGAPASEVEAAALAVAEASAALNLRLEEWQSAQEVAW